MTITISKKALILVAAIILVLGGVVGGTVAWLTATSETVTNTFTFGNVNITLTETTGTSYKLVPGTEIEKDPKVTVLANSEDCYVFVKIEANEYWANAKASYAIAEGWTQGNGTNIPNNVYYREVSNNLADVSFYILSGNKITVSENLTRADIQALDTNIPSLSFTAYAIQQAGMNDDVATAWSKIGN